MTVWGNLGTEPPLCLPQSRLNGALWHKRALTMGRTLVCRASPSAFSLSVPQPKGMRLGAAGHTNGGRGWGKAEAESILDHGGLRDRAGRLDQGP